MKIKNAKAIRWANQERTAIDMLVTFEGIKERLPYTATKDDSAEHGRELFRRAVAGEYGKIGEPKP